MHDYAVAVMLSLKRYLLVVSNYNFRKGIYQGDFYNLLRYNMNVTTLFFNYFRFKERMV